MNAILRHYRDKLIDSSQKNKAVFLPRLSKTHFFDLHRIDFWDNSPSFAALSSVIAQAKTPIARQSDARNAAGNQAAGDLRLLSRTAEYAWQEHGSRSLYIGWPFLHGITTQANPLRAPLLLQPVELVPAEGKWVIVPQSGLALNKSLLHALSGQDGIHFAPEFIEEDFSSFSSDALEFRTRLYNLLQEHLPGLHFGVDTFRDQLIPFVEYAKEDFKNLHQTGCYTLKSEAVLGIFAIADGYMMPDYDAMLANEDLMRTFQSLWTHQAPETKTAESSLLTPYPCDIWQQQALQSVQAGQSLVVQGPPGSGKSQLITNLVVDAIAKGKKVLVVSQKRQALDIIMRRLQTQGFHSYASLVHDFAKDQKTLYQNLASLIEKLELYTFEAQKPTAQTKLAEFELCCQQIESACQEFEQFRVALFDQSRFGLSPKWLYHAIKPGYPAVNLRPIAESLHAEKLPDFTQKLKIFLRYTSHFERAGFSFADRVSFAGYKRERLAEITQAIEQTATLKAKMGEFYERMIPNSADSSVSMGEIDFILDKTPDINLLIDLISAPAVFDLFKNLLQASLPDPAQLNSQKSLLLSLLDEPMLAYCTLTEVIDLQHKVLQAQEKAKNFFTGLGWRLLSADRVAINRHLIAQGLAREKRPYNLLLKQVDNRLNFEHIVSYFAGLEWASDFPKGHDKTAYLKWFDDLQTALKAKELFVSLKNLTHLFEMQGADSELITRKLIRMLNLSHQIKALYEQIALCLSATQIDQLLENPDLAVQYQSDLNTEFDDLVFFDGFLLELGENRAVMEELLGISREYEYLRECFLQNVYQTMLRALETSAPELTLPSTQKIFHLEEALQTAITQKTTLSREIAHLNIKKIIARPFDHLPELAYQLDKKRSIMPLRKLIARFTDSVMGLIPCWLASPDTVSAIFPLDTVFDLIIFDEASQCPLERGLACLFRARQLVICGDSKQLPPYDLYKPQIENDDPDTDKGNSLLDFALIHLPQLMLRGHYRSENPLMIGFSNTHFYGGKLRFVEHHSAFVSQTPPLSYIKVNGSWDKGTNQAEAEKVMDLLRKLHDSSIHNIGIVTFNYPQQQLIEDLCETWQTSAPKPLIRNIENIQGDERDVIIFSIGYAKGDGGKAHSHFGLLNRAGGENRLNVAITRARKHLFVVTSLAPDELKVDDTLHEGPRLLRLYLHYAQAVSSGNAMSTLHQSEPQLTESAIIAGLSQSEYRKGLGIFTAAGVMTGDDEDGFWSSSVKDAYGLWPIELSDKGWAHRRFYARNLWLSADNFRLEVKKFTAKSED